jgi:hypothetical protein
MKPLYTVFSESKEINQSRWQSWPEQFLFAFGFITVFNPLKNLSVGITIKTGFDIIPQVSNHPSASKRKCNKIPCAMTAISSIHFLEV